ncbi:hypothetical protein SD10_28290 [Spirosoma radiotolerans]|uniref:Carbohydrate-binding domain-containing protein n=1 Tax=Spirosoma radiotolerans TaxID=1379870 RepID=A0A0E3ZZH5_9BACT|nr:hypothetical protein SD10_28290 [Spirosoma radiotolerans]
MVFHQLVSFRLVIFCLVLIVDTHAQDAGQLVVRKTTDFSLTSNGSASNWAKTEWVPITVQESSGTALATRAKLLYSDTGVYFLFFCEDQKLTATLTEDFASLFKEDVVEVFLWPDQSVPIYLEYEISPLNYELAILVPNLNGKFQGWRPWHYQGAQRTRHETSVQGGEKKSLSAIKSWMAEFFIPYRLLQPLVQTPPKPGSQWRANLYRIDYDQGYTTWTWQKTTPRTAGNFHEFKKYGTLIFE